MEIYVIVPLLSLVGAGFGAYLGSYLKKKGENLATREDVGELVKQVAAVTQTTKEIEAKISSEVWDRQRHWEMKRDALFDAARRLEAMHDALTKLYAAQSVLKKSEPTPYLLEEVAKAVNVMRQAFGAFDATEAVTALVCGPEVRDALRAADQLIRGTAKEIFAGNLNVYECHTPNLVKALVQASAAIRKELGVDE